MSQAFFTYALIVTALFSIEARGGTITFEQPASSSPQSRYIRALACYVGEGIEDKSIENCRQKSAVSAKTERLPQAAAEQLGQAINPNSHVFELAALRNWWNTWAYGLRDSRRTTRIIANDLETFKKATAFRTWRSEVVAPSIVKERTRVIYRSPESMVPGISVAETYDTVVNDPNADIIETEIAIDRDDGSGNADFFSYDRNGQLSTVALFPAGEKLVPGICMGCHYSPSRGTFGRMDWAGE